MFSYVRVLLLTSRPALWWVHVLLFMAGYLVSGAVVDARFWVFSGLLAFPGSLVVYGVNDVFDYASDKVNPRKNSLSGFVLEPRYHVFVLRAVVVSVLVLGVVVLSTRNWFTILSASALLFLVFAYSVPPLRLKQRGVVDSFSNALMVLCIGLLGFSFGGSFAQVPLAAYVALLLVVSIHVLCAFMDYSADKLAGQSTVAVVLGKRLAMILGGVCAGVALAWFWFMSFPAPIVLVAGLLFMTCLVLAVYPSEALARRLQWPLVVICAGCTVLVLYVHVW